MAVGSAVITIHPATAHITLSSVLLSHSISEVDCYMLHGIRPSLNNFLSSVHSQYIVKNQLSCFSHFLRLSYNFITGISYIFGTKQAFYIENRF